MVSKTEGAKRLVRRETSQKPIPGKKQMEPERVTLGLRKLLPYIKDWDAWQRELKRLEGNVVKLRSHKSLKLAKTLELSLPVLRFVLEEERVNHQFTVNRFIAELDELD